MFSCHLRQLFVSRLFFPFMHFPAFFARYSLFCLRRQLLVFPPFSPVTRFPAFLARYSLPAISGVFDRLLVHQSPSVLHFPALLTSYTFLCFSPLILSPRFLRMTYFLSFTFRSLSHVYPRWISPLQSFCLTSPLTRLLTLNFSPFSPRHAWQSIAMSHPKPISKLNTHSMKNKCRVFLLLNDLQLQLSY